MQPSERASVFQFCGPDAIPTKRKLSIETQGSHPKRRKKQPASTPSDSRTNRSVHLGNMARLEGGISFQDSGRSAGFHIHSGTRKLKIKNLRNAPRSDPKDHYGHLWGHIEKALLDIYAGQPPVQPLELLYRDVEDICRNGQAEDLYKHLSSTCTTYLKECLMPTISAALPQGSSEVDILRAVYNAWEMWNKRSVCLHGYTKGCQ